MVPLALRVAMPGLANSMIEILLDTVVLSVVGVVEIFYSRTLYFYQFFQGRLESLLVIVPVLRDHRRASEPCGTTPRAAALRDRASINEPVRLV